MAETSNGTIILNSRNEKPGVAQRVRLVVVSSDGACARVLACVCVCLYITGLSPMV